VVVVGRGQVPGIILPVVAIVVVVAVTCRRVAVVVREKVTIRIPTRFLVLILDPGQT